MLTESDTKYWGPNVEILVAVGNLIPEGARVLEVGPGTSPFHRATHFIDCTPRGPNSFIADLERDRLPFPDKYFDFLYCRHTLEDIRLTDLALSEFNRIAKAGYIETPSPMAEMCRGVDGTSPNWRGYFHHSHVVYESADGVLSFMRKAPALDSLQFPNEQLFENALRHSNFLWNTYHLWEGELRWQTIQPTGPYDLVRLVEQAALESIASTQRFIETLTRRQL